MTVARRDWNRAKMHPQWRPKDRGHKGIHTYLMMRPWTGDLV